MLKRALCLLLCILLAGIMVCFAEGNTIVINDDFEQYDVGKSPANYLYKAGAAATVADLDGNRVLNMDATGEGTASAERQFNKLEGMVSISMDIMSQTSGVSRALQVWDETRNNNKRAFVLYKAGSDINLDTGDGVVTLYSGCILNQWDNIRVIADMNAQTLTVYVNGNRVGADKTLTFFRQTDNIAITQFVAESGSQLYVDNLLVEQLTNPISVAVENIDYTLVNAVFGTEAGQYPYSARTVLEDCRKEAVELMNSAELSEDEQQRIIDKCETAIEVFQSRKIKGKDALDLFTESFEAYSPGSTPPGYLVATGVSVVSENDFKAACLAHEGTRARLLKSVPSSEAYGILSFSVSFMQKEKSEITNIIDAADASGNVHAFCVYSDGTDILVKNGGAENTVVLADYQVNTWYDLEILANTYDQTFSISVDGVKIYDALDFWQDVTMLNRLFNAQLDGAGTLFLDNISVCKQDMASDPDKENSVSVEGKRLIQIPKAAQAEYVYSASIMSQYHTPMGQATLCPENELKGVDYDGDSGRLVVSPEADEGILKLKAATDQENLYERISVYVIKGVQLNPPEMENGMLKVSGDIKAPFGYLIEVTVWDAEKATVLGTGDAISGSDGLFSVLVDLPAETGTQDVIVSAGCDELEVLAFINAKYFGNDAAEAALKLLKTASPEETADILSQYGIYLGISLGKTFEDNQLQIADDICNAIASDPSLILNADNFRHAYEDVYIIYELKQTSRTEIEAFVDTYYEVLSRNGLSSRWSRVPEGKQEEIYIDLLAWDGSNVKQLVDDLNDWIEDAFDTKPIVSAGGSRDSRPSKKSLQTVTEVETNTDTDGKIQVFSDISIVPWAESDIMNLYQMGIIQGKKPGFFQPMDNITREEFVKLIVIAFGLEDPEAQSEFHDAERGTWYYPYVSSAYEAGVVKGDASGNFGIGETITRQDMATICYRAAQTAKIDLYVKNTVDEPWADEEQISPYAKEAVDALKKAGLISGMGDNYFSPQGLVTRAQAAKIINNIILIGWE